MSKALIETKITYRYFIYEKTLHLHDSVPPLIVSMCLKLMHTPNTFRYRSNFRTHDKAHGNRTQVQNMCPQTNEDLK